MKSAEQKAKNVPAIRFAGFDDEWEKLSFADVGNVCMCKRVFKEETSDKGDIPFYKIGTFGGIPDAYITKELYNEYRTKFSYPEKGDILLSAAGTIGRIVEYDGESAYFQDSNIVWLSHDKSITNKFLKVLYPTLKWGGIEGSTIQRLYNDIFLKTSFFKPTISEQQKIGSFFSNIDSLISLEQKKYDKLTQVKKSMLEKMFPKEGATVPEIRFAGFSGVWVWKELDDIIVRIATGLNPRDNFKLNSGGSNYYVTIKNFEHGHLYLDEKCDRIDDCALQLIQARSDLQKDDLLFSSIGRIGDCYLIKNNPQNWNINESVFTLRPNKAIAASNYLFHVVHCDIVLSQILDSVTGSTFKSIKIGDLKKALIPIPCKEEQIQIANYLDNLDSLISLQQRKLEKLKNIKKSLLEKMFV